jgi:hypothetical protein
MDIFHAQVQPRRVVLPGVCVSQSVLSVQKAEPQLAAAASGSSDSGKARTAWRIIIPDSPVTSPHTIASFLRSPVRHFAAPTALRERARRFRFNRN